MNIHAVKTFVRFRLKQRIRSNKWFVSLVLSFLAIVAVFVVFIIVTYNLDIGREVSRFPVAIKSAIEITLCVLLGIGIIVTPLTAATTINGSREKQTLAVIQSTRITNLELAMGEFIAAWLSSIIFIFAGSVGLILLGFFTDAWPQYLASVAIIIIQLGCLSGISLGLSALFSRPGASAAISILVTGLLVAGFSVLSVSLGYGSYQEVKQLTEELSVEQDDHSYTDQSEGENIKRNTVLASNIKELSLLKSQYPNIRFPTLDFSAGDKLVCVRSEKTTLLHKTRSVSWLSNLNPYVQLADINLQISKYRDPKLLKKIYDYDHKSSVVLTALGYLVHKFYNLNYIEPTISCLGKEIFPAIGTDTMDDYFWYKYLGILAAAGVGGVAFATRRLKIPYKSIPKGVRVS